MSGGPEPLAVFLTEVETRARCTALAEDHTKQAADAFVAIRARGCRDAEGAALAMAAPLCERVRADGAELLRTVARDPGAPGLEGACRFVVWELSTLAALFAPGSEEGGLANGRGAEYRAICHLLGLMQRRLAEAEPAWRAVRSSLAISRGRPPPRSAQLPWRSAPAGVPKPAPAGTPGLASAGVPGPALAGAPRPAPAGAPRLAPAGAPRPAPARPAQPRRSPGGPQ